MALRNQILKPGCYASVPHCILASKRLQPSDKLVYIAILDHLGKKKTTWPAIDTIMKETALSRRSVLYSIKKLKEMGLMQVISGFTGVPNTYTFEIPEMVLENVIDAANSTPRLGVMASAKLAP